MKLTFLNCVPQQLRYLILGLFIYTNNVYAQRVEKPFSLYLNPGIIKKEKLALDAQLVLGKRFLGHGYFFYGGFLGAELHQLPSETVYLPKLGAEVHLSILALRFSAGSAFGNSLPGSVVFLVEPGFTLAGLATFYFGKEISNDSSIPFGTPNRISLRFMLGKGMLTD